MTRTPGERLGQFVNLLDDTGQNMTPTVATLAALQAVEAAAFSGGEKRNYDGSVWVWLAQDLTAAFAAQGTTYQGLLVKADDVAVGVGGWFRMSDTAAVQAEWFIEGDGVADDIGPLTAANAVADYFDRPLEIASAAVRTTSTFSVTAPELITHNTRITKDLDDTEVIRFIGPVVGAGKFKYHTGLLFASQSSKPSTLQTAAHSFVFEDVILSNFGALTAEHCAYSFVNDETSAHGLCWGNSFQRIQARGCVQGYMNFTYPGSGAHTENFFAAAYLNGKELTSGTLLPKEDTPIRLNNAEGFVFGTLNFEWTKRTGGGNFISVLNDSTLIINAFHPEGLEQTDAVNAYIFNLNNAGTTRCNVTINNFHINGFNQTAGRLSIVGATGSTQGAIHIGMFSGAASSNTLSDFRLIDSSTDVGITLGNDSGVFDYISNLKAGNYPSNFKPTVWLGSSPFEAGYTINNPGATLAIGQASFLRLTGTSTANITDISSESVTNERARLVTIENDTSATIDVVGGGNVRGNAGAALPVTIPINGRAVFSVNINDSRAELVSVSA